MIPETRKDSTHKKSTPVPVSAVSGNIGAPERVFELLLDSALDLISTAKGKCRGSVLLLDSRGEALKLSCSRGLKKQCQPQSPMPLAGPAEQAIREKRALHFANPLNRGRGILESLVCPLSINGRVLGSLNLSREDGSPWSEADCSRVIQFTNRSSWILEESNRREDQRLRIEELDRTLAFTRIFASTRELSKILELLLSCGRDVTGAVRSFVTIFDEGGGQYASYAAHQIPQDNLDRIISNLRDRFGHAFFARNEAMQFQQLADLGADHPLKPLYHERLGQSVVVVPLVFGYRVLGRLFLLDPRQDLLEENTLRILSILSQEAAIAIDQGRAFFELRDQAFRDSLTRITNRNYWMQRFEEETTRSRRQNLPLSMLMVDIDHFKVYNDTYGHQVGDEVLKAVAGVIQSCLREVDVVGRYGGEEFGVLLPDTDENGANYVAERIRLRVMEMDLGQRSSPAGSLTVSVGCYTSHGQRPESTEQILRAADTALLYSKSRGRNRVSLYTPVGIRPGNPALEKPEELENSPDGLESSSDFLFRMVDSLKGKTKQAKGPGASCGFNVMIAGGASGEHLMLEKLFKDLGYSVHLHEDLDLKLHAALKRSMDLVILDLSDNRESSSKLLKQMKEHDPYLPIIVLTENEGIEDAVSAMRLGADDYLLKPFGVEEIRSSAEKAFSQRLRILKMRQDGSAVESKLELDLRKISDDARRDFANSARDLKLLQEFNRRSIENLMNGVLLLDAEYRVIHMNRMAQEMLSCKASGSRQLNLAECCPELGGQRVREALEGVSQSGREAILKDLRIETGETREPGLYKLRIQPSSEEHDEGMLLELESLVDSRLLKEEARRVRMGVARQIFGQIAQHLQVISGRSELLEHKNNNDQRLSHELNQISHSAKEIGRILKELGTDS